MGYVSEIAAKLRAIVLKSQFNRCVKHERLVEKELEHQQFIHEGRETYWMPSDEAIMQLALKFAAVYASYGMLSMDSQENLKRMGIQVGTFFEDLGLKNFFGGSSWVGFNRMLQASDRKSRYPELWEAITNPKSVHV